MIFFLLELGLSTGWWGVSKTYNGVKYLVYGNEPTTEEVMIQELQDLKKEIKELKSINKLN